MKKKLALLLAAVMVAAMVPVSAFADSKNHLTSTVVVKANDYLTTNAPELKIETTDDLTSGVPFELVLDGAEWKLTSVTAPTATDTDATAGRVLKVGGKATLVAGLEVILLNSTTLSVTPVGGDFTGDITVPLQVKVTGEEASVTVVDGNSEVSAGTYTFAATTSSAATATSNGVVEVEVEGTTPVALKSIVLAETVKGAIDNALGKNVITLKLYGNFKFGAGTATAVSNNGIVATETLHTDDEIELTVTTEGTTAGKVSINGITILADGAKEGDVAEIVISGAGVSKTTFEVAKAINYGVSFTAADKKLPVYYAGRVSTDETLEVTFKELAEDSWWDARKTTLTFPEGVKVDSVTFSGEKNIAPLTADIDGNVVTLNVTRTDSAKAEWKAKFVLSVSPDFTGDITCTVGGPSLKEDITVVVAEAQYAVTFEVETSDVSIDYRNVAVGDITVKEAFAGALKENTILTFAVDAIGLEGNAKVELVEGDIEVELTDAEFARTIAIEVKDESYKTPATFKITGVEAFLGRELPAGNYDLKVTSNDMSIFENYAKKADIKKAEKFDTEADLIADTTVLTGTAAEIAAVKAAWACFPIDSYTLAEDYINVVTAGRDQDDSTFTTQVKVTVGAYTMQVGNTTVAVDSPAYNKDGYIYLPVRAVADALSGEGATVLWNGETKTVTIAFGARIISMTVGSKVMNINGVEIGTLTAPEITGDRTFLGVRDLGYALGLTDAKINWDGETNTATLN